MSQANHLPNRFELQLIYILICGALLSVIADPLPTCQANDFKYDFTECDSFEGRWRVSVPISPGKCTGGAPNAPIRVDNCYSSCESGQFFNMTTLLCEHCDPGHYSLGGGIIIDSFNNSLGHLPSGFHIVTESTKHTSELNKKCNGWYVDSVTNHLVSSIKEQNRSEDSVDFGNGCVSAVTYTAKVVKSGRIRFTYHYRIPDDVPFLFTFHYRLYDGNNILNEGENSKIEFPPTTVEQNFETIDIPLESTGLYIFTWKSVLFGSFRNFFSLHDSRFGQFGNDFGLNRNENSKDVNQVDSFQSRLASNGVIRIKRITIEGVAYASECTSCEPGTFAADSGMRECLPCAANTAYPGFGARKCLPCDPLTEYSSQGSAQCRKRPTCGNNDFYQVPKEKCDPITKKQLVEFKWIEPRICVDTNSIFASRNKYVNCTESDNLSNNECDLGMELKRDGASEFCQFCPSSNYRDEHSSLCQPCPPFTSPSYMLTIVKWNNSLPAWSSAHDLPNSIGLNEDYFADNPEYLNSYLSRQCIRAEEEATYQSTNTFADFHQSKSPDEAKSDECSSKIAWQPFHDHIRTGASAMLDSYLVLSIAVPGFRTISGGEVRFVFETICESGDKCEFLFVETKNDESDLQELSGKDDFLNKKKPMSLSQQMNSVIKEWSGSTDGRLSFRYKVDKNISVTYSWIFKRVSSFQSYAKIHSLTITNSLIGAAVKCKNCPILTKSTSDCITCPEGNYLDVNASNVEGQDSLQIESSKISCKRCPENHILNTSVALPIGIKSCLACGINLVTDNQTNECYSNCLVRFGEDTFDLRELPQPLHYNGVNLFTAAGTQYLHLFRITLCGHRKHATLSTCLNNITAFAEETVSSGIRSFICRSTIIPDSSNTFATQSVSLGDELIGITRKTTFQNITVHKDFISTLHSDFYLYFLTKTITNACPRGRTLTVTMRCSPGVQKTSPGKAIVSTPKSCPDGTCDGCNFHLLIESGTAATCRLCRPFSEDYETVVGECIDGTQAVHFINPRNCAIKGNASHPIIQTRSCSVLLPRQIQFAIAFVIAIGLLLLLLVFYFWNKNRSLEYKYTKLIESAGEGKGGDDMALDNCCVENEEEEESTSSTIHSANYLMFSNERGQPVSKHKVANNRLSTEKSKVGTSREMQNLFKPEVENRNVHRVDDDGYETIHLTSAAEPLA